MLLIVAPAVAFMLLAALPLTSATPTAESERAIPPIIWELVDLPDEAGNPQEIAEPERYTIQFLPEGRVAIVADCNRVAGSYGAGDGTLSLTLGPSTLALCPPDSQADQFTNALIEVIAFEYDEEGQLLFDTQAGVLRFRPTLGGVRWEWQEFQSSDDSVTTPDHPERYAVEFLPEEKLAIQADCNRAVGTYDAKEPELSLTIGGVTRAFCGEDSLMDRFLRDLEAVSSFVFRDGSLYMALKMDAGIMRFEARAIEPEATPVAGDGS